jgi:ribosomal subunit interface protein
MQTPVEISWHNMDPAPHIEKRVNERVARLEKFFGRIIASRVVIEAPHQRHRVGNEYEVRVEVTVPGGILAIDRRPGNDHAHADPLVALRDAFDAMERKLRRWKDEHSGRPELHETGRLQGRVAELDRAAGAGHIAVTDGRLVYFHRNSVVDGSFDEIEVDDPVELVIAPPDDAEGLHASTVRPIGAQRFVAAPR